VRHHEPLVTAAFSDDGEQATIQLTCNACDSESFHVRTDHLAALASALVGICGFAAKSLDSPVRIVDLGTPENLRRAHARYAAYVKELRAGRRDNDS
jgi:hypothetical protein